MPHDVIISYATIDKPIADAVCAKLEERGIRCWIAPRDILAGMDYAEAIISAIDNAKLMVLIFSSHANASKHVMREAERAVHDGYPIIPVRIEDVEPNPSLQYYISAQHWLDALTPPLEQHILELAEAVTLLLGTTTPRVAPSERTTPPQPPQPPRRPITLSRKKLVLSVVIVLVAVSAITAGYYGSTSSTPNVSPSPTLQQTFVPKNNLGYLNYTNRSAGVGIQYPPSWTVVEGGLNTSIATFSLPGTAVKFLVLGPVDLSSMKITVDEFSQLLLTEMKNKSTTTNFSNFVVLNSTNTTLAGYPAQEHVFTAVTNGVTMQGTLELTIANNTGYALEYVATAGVYPDYGATANNMTPSFYIIK